MKWYSLPVALLSTVALHDASAFSVDKPQSSADVMSRRGAFAKGATAFLGVASSAMTSFPNAAAAKPKKKMEAVVSKKRPAEAAEDQTSSKKPKPQTSPQASPESSGKVAEATEPQPSSPKPPASPTAPAA